MTHPLPEIPAGMPITAFPLRGVHGAIWTWWYLTDPEGVDSQLRWRSDGHADWYATVDQLNAAHGPLTCPAMPYPVEDRTRTATSTDGNQWQWSDVRSGWVQTVTPPADESDDAYQWNWLVYEQGASYQ